VRETREPIQRSATFWKKTAEQEGLAPPSRLGRLRGHKSARGQLRDWRLVAADVEIARQQGRPTHQAELIRDEGPLAATDLAAQVEREEGEPGVSGLNRLGSRPAQCVRAPIRIRSVGVLVFPLHANSTGGDGSSTRAIWSSGVRERIAKPMPNGSSRGSDFE
jgi:hypothetical protein